MADQPLLADAAGPRAILRVPDILLAVARARDGCTLADLARRLHVPKTSLHRLLRTLESGGFLVERGGSFRLGQASFHLARTIGMAAPGGDLQAAARPTLEWLAGESGETVMLAVPGPGPAEIVYVDVIDSRAPVRFTVPVGDVRPLYSAAAGQAVLAFMGPEAQQAYLDTADFIAFTPHTLDRKALRRKLPSWRQSGIACDDGGKVVGASGLASPIFDTDGEVCGSVSVAGPTDRLRSDRLRLEPLVVGAAERISRTLGFRGAWPRGSPIDERRG